MIENCIDEIEGIKTMYRSPKITMQAYFRFPIRYDPEKWAGVHKNIFIKALSAELEDSVGISGTYEPLNNSPIYRPHNKKTHHISKEYWDEIDPQKI